MPSVAGETLRCLRSVDAAEGPCGRRVPVSRRTAATCVSWRMPGAVGRNRTAGHPTRTRAGNVLQGVSGNTLRQASLPCLDTKISYSAPLVVYPLNLWLLVACVCVSSSTSKYFRTALRAFDPHPVERMQLHHGPGTLTGRPTCIEDWDEFGKIFPSPCSRGARPDVYWW